MQVPSFIKWIAESAVKKYTKKLKELNPQRKYLGDTYNTDILLRFKHLSSIRERHGKRIGVERWFEIAQSEDPAFYAAVLADQMGQPDVRELWRDLMGRNASKVKGQVAFKDPFKPGREREDEVRDLVSENTQNPDEPITITSKIDPQWKVTVSYPEDFAYSKLSPYFEKFGIAFSNLNEKHIYVDGAEVSESYFTENHLLAVEAHEIAHWIAKHQGEPYYSEKQEMEADWLAYHLLVELGHTGPASLLSTRYSDFYGEILEETENESLARLLQKYLN